MVDLTSEDIMGWATRKAEDGLRDVALEQARAAVPQDLPLVSSVEALADALAPFAGDIDAMLAKLAGDLVAHLEGTAITADDDSGAVELRDVIGPQVASDLLAWARAMAPPDFMVLGGLIGVASPEVFAGWLSVLRGT
jgi:hypothetical protein